LRRKKLSEEEGRRKKKEEEERRRGRGQGKEHKRTESHPRVEPGNEPFAGIGLIRSANGSSNDDDEIFYNLLQPTTCKLLNSTPLKSIQSNEVKCN
jgi:hypothetical protein